MEKATLFQLDTCKYRCFTKSVYIALMWWRSNQIQVNRLYNMVRFTWSTCSIIDSTNTSLVNTSTCFLDLVLENYLLRSLTLHTTHLVNIHNYPTFPTVLGWGDLKYFFFFILSKLNEDVFSSKMYKQKFKIHVFCRCNSS